MKVRVDLAKLRGRWVVLFFCPGDFTCMCPTEIAALAVKYPALLELGVEILAVSRLAAQARQISEIFSS